MRAEPGQGPVVRRELRRAIGFLAAIWGALAGSAALPSAAEGPLPAGDGPYPTLIVRGALLVDGTGAALRGPVDIVVRGDRIERIVGLGHPDLAPDPARRPVLPEGGRELDAAGMTVLPGLVDLYGHLPEPVDYVAGLWLAHGVTTVREPVCERGAEACLALASAAEARDLAAPRIVPWLHFEVGRRAPFAGAAEAREWLAGIARSGVAGVKFRGERPEVFAAALAEAEARGLLTSAHLAAAHVARFGAVAAAEAGLDLLEHWYGLPEALLARGTVPAVPPAFNDSDERQRFAEAGRLWRQAAPRGSPRWREVIAALAGRGVTLVPTLSLYEANRDLHAARTAEWHPLYALPEVWDAFAPDRRRHATHFDAWSSEDEAAWRENLRIWMDFLTDYRDAGGRVAVGSDAGFMYSLYGFATVREMELLREAGFHPLEVVRAATLAGAEALGRATDLGSVEPGKFADLLVVEGNPLADLKLLYGTGALRLGADGTPRRTGGVRWTIRGGVVHDASALRRRLRERVATAWAAAGRTWTQPGLER